MFRALQKTDPRCKNQQLLAQEDKQAPADLAEVVKTLALSLEPEKKAQRELTCQRLALPDRIGWRKSGEYQVWTQKLDPMDFIAGNVKGKRAAPKTISRSAK